MTLLTLLSVACMLRISCEHCVKKIIPCQNIVPEATWPRCSDPNPVHEGHTIRAPQCVDLLREQVYVTTFCMSCQKTNTAQKPRGASPKLLRRSLRLKARRCGSRGSSCVHGDHPHPLPDPLAWLQAIGNTCVTCFVWQRRER